MRKGEQQPFGSMTSTAFGEREENLVGVLKKKERETRNTQKSEERVDNHEKTKRKRATL